jgi:hypothetical protein
MRFPTPCYAYLSLEYRRWERVIIDDIPLPNQLVQLGEGYIFDQLYDDLIEFYVTPRCPASLPLVFGAIMGITCIRLTQLRQKPSYSKSLVRIPVEVSTEVGILGLMKMD